MGFEETFTKNENIITFALLILLGITLYVTYIGYSIVSKVTDIDKTEPLENKSVMDSMENIMFTAKVLMWISIGFIGVIFFGNLGSNWPNLTLGFSKVGANIFLILALAAVAILMSILSSICENIKEINTLYPDNATANDVLTNRGVFMTVIGSVSCAIVLVGLILYRLEIEKTKGIKGPPPLPPKTDGGRKRKY
jgi:archaellum component FlaF (FlaF/FlaG flagellin family)